MDQLTAQLRTGLYGQHVAVEEITEALTGFTEDSSRKDTLVLLLAGWLGSGKTHTSNLISKVYAATQTKCILCGFYLQRSTQI